MTCYPTAISTADCRSVPSRAHLVGQVSGHLPLARTKAAADAYRSVLDRVDADFRCDVQELIEKLDFEHEKWQSATQNIDWHTQDTLFVSLT